MSHWIVRLKPGAEVDLAKLDKSVRQQVLDKLAWLEENFDNVLPRPLSRELAGFFKLRVGDWRVVYVVDQKAREISVRGIDHRTKIYERHFQ